jgi:3-oxoacyl-[acyl-carrier protein] reductase
MDLGLKGKVALVTGGSRGLGRAMARALAEEGATVCICARGADALEAAAGELKRFGVAASAVDVTDAAQSEKWVRDSAAKFRGIDVLINNAGGAKMGTLAETTDQLWRDAFELNTFAAVRLARLCVPHMERRGGGVIINISSIWGREAGGLLTYNASKAALISFTKMLARELAPKAIRVNSIAPGSILYPGGSWERRFRADPAFERDFISHECPAGRLGTPDEVAYSVLMLASPRASWITGATIPVDGAQGRSLI